jgi:hypothetical protein
VCTMPHRCRITTLLDDRAWASPLAEICKEATGQVAFRWNWRIDQSAPSIKMPAAPASGAIFNMECRQPFAAVFASESSTPDAQALAKL